MSEIKGTASAVTAKEIVCQQPQVNKHYDSRHLNNDEKSMITRLIQKDKLPKEVWEAVIAQQVAVFYGRCGLSTTAILYINNLPTYVGSVRRFWKDEEDDNLARTHAFHKALSAPPIFSWHKRVVTFIPTWTNDSLRKAIRCCKSYADVAGFLGVKNNSKIKRALRLSCKELELDTKHFANTKKV